MHDVFQQCYSRMSFEFCLFPDLVHHSRCDSSCYCNYVTLVFVETVNNVLVGSDSMTSKAFSGCRLAGLRPREQITFRLQREHRKEKLPALRQEICLQRILIPRNVIFLLIQELLLSFPEEIPCQTYLKIY